KSFPQERVLYLRRWKDESEIFAALNFNPEAVTLRLIVPAGRWKKQFDSADPRWSKDSDLAKPMKAHTLKSEGEVEVTLAPQSFVLYLKASDE
ncbi:MAG TPA: alpha amylase C-terminal domain-containing protein, partial [Phototrophicaceae bacterium]|nr:alpha amylase C-terminal domain-containing protein [Phototrophicaceae bacterium]